MDSKKNILDQLSAYIDGELSERDSRSVESAMERDEQICNHVKQLRGVRRTLRSLPSESAGNDFTERVMQQVRAGKQQTLPWRRLVYYLSAAAMVLVTFSVGYHIMKPVGSPGPVETDTLAVAKNPDNIGQVPEKVTADGGVTDLVSDDSGKPATLKVAAKGFNASATSNKFVIYSNDIADTLEMVRVECSDKPGNVMHARNGDLSAASQEVQTFSMSGNMRSQRNSLQTASSGSTEAEFVICGTSDQLKRICAVLRKRVQVVQQVSQLSDQQYTMALSGMQLMKNSLNVDRDQAMLASNSDHKLNRGSTEISMSVDPDVCQKDPLKNVLSGDSSEASDLQKLVVVVRYRKPVKLSDRQMKSVVAMEHASLGINVSRRAKFLSASGRGKGKKKH